MNQPKFFGYTRVSKENSLGNNVSIKSQTEALIKEANLRGYELELINEGEGVSARKLSNRPHLLETLERLDRGEAQGLIVTKLDRLARSTIDFLTIVERSQRKGWSLIVLDFAIDTTTPIGVLTATLLASFAQFERQMISERTKNALAFKKTQGVKIGRSAVISDQEIYNLRKMRSQGMTLQSIAEALNERNIPTAHNGNQWHASTVSYLLKRAS